MQYPTPNLKSNYICSPYAEYKPEPTDVKKRVTAPDTVVIGGVTYYRQKTKKAKVSSSTVISLRLENQTVETVDAIRNWLCSQDDETELTRAGAIKNAVADWIEKYNPDRIYDEMNNGQGYEENQS